MVPIKKIAGIIGFVAVVAIFFVSCTAQYSFTGASIDYQKVKTVSVDYFPNNASLGPPDLGQTFTEALKDLFVSQTNLSLVQQDGDLNFQGSISRYVTQPVAIQGNETAALNRLTIAVQVKFVNKADKEQNYETSFSRFADFDSSKNLSDVESQLIDEITEQLVRDIYNKAVQNW